MVAAPRNEATFKATPLLSKFSIAWPNEVNFLSFQKGPGEVPSPNISNVTPCLRSDRALPSCIKVP